MTREEAKEELQSMCDHLHAHGICDKDSNMLTACKMAISALEQKPYDVQKIYDLKTGLSDWVVLPKLEQKPCEDIAQERYKDLCEYFGGAKDILKSREDFKAWLGRVKWHIRKAEELYEKYEYKKEPCDDAISRILKRMWNCRSKHTTSIDKVAMEQIIRDELSVTQKPIECEDAISREAVLDEIDDTNRRGGFGCKLSYTRCRGHIEHLPSVTQKCEKCVMNGSGSKYCDNCGQNSGRCKNCKYFEHDSVAKVDGIPLIVAHEICNKWGDGCKTSEDGYCYLYEPQESEE